MPAAELWLLLASCVACVTAAWAAARLVRRRSVQVDRWMPEGLKDHTLAYSERTFRSGDDWQVVARVDRAYRGQSGLVVLVELKTRQADRVHLSDIIELSAQRVALEGETGESVAPVAWVVVESAAGRSAHSVRLLSPHVVWDLASRREALLAGTESPHYPATSRVCASCIYCARCRMNS